MPNKINGSTDVTGGVSLMGSANKAVLIVGIKGTAGSMADLEIESIFSAADALAKVGADAPMLDLIDVLLTNGAQSIKVALIDTAQATEPEKYEKAFDELLTESDSFSTIILDIEYDVDVMVKLEAHLATCEVLNIMRYAVIGDAVATIDADLKANAGAIGNKRIFFVGPDLKESSVLTRSGTFGAAALSAKIAIETLDPALPMNGVEITGFLGTARVMLPTQLDDLVANQVTPFYLEGGQLMIYRLVTTSTDATWQEGTTIFTADYCLNAVRNKLVANYKRTKGSTRILESIKGDINSVLATIEAMDIIENFDPTKTSVIKDPADTYGALIDYEIDVVTPLYTLTIRQHLKI